jgi:hypothetical protein
VSLCLILLSCLFRSSIYLKKLILLHVLTYDCINYRTKKKPEKTENVDHTNIVNNKVCDDDKKNMKIMYEQVKKIMICNIWKIIYTFIIIVIIIISNKFFIKQYTYYNNKSILINNTRSLVLCVGFVDRCLSFCPFSFGHCIVCRVMDSDCPIGIMKLFLHNNILYSTIKTHIFWCF